MAELDLTDPSQLAELLRASLPGFDDETPERVAPLVEVLEHSDNDVFAGVGKGKRPQPQSPNQQQQQQAPKQQVADQQALPDPQQQAQQGPKKKSKKKKKKAEEEHAKEMAPQPPVEQKPLDMGGEGLLIDPQPEGPSAEYGRLPVFARRGWTEIDRVRSKGKHAIYRLAAKHTREKPIHSGFIGNCQSVRVSLPFAKPDSDAFIGTWIGTVEAKDHLLFSVEETIAAYFQVFGHRPALTRVDVITGPRFRGRRFSPISIYLGYESNEPDAKPIIYMLEGGSASGKPEALYVARTISSDIKTQSNFQFTPFSCNQNWYEGGLAMDSDLAEPVCVYLSASLERDGRHQYFKLSVNYERDLDPERVVHPFELQVEAAMRVLAIADEAGCKLRVGGGGGLQQSLGPVARALIPWETRPNGTTTPQERDMFCGCRKD